jgi:hypothetical protein
MGIIVVGAEIDGKVDLEWARISFAIRAKNCVFRDAIVLNYGQVAFLNLGGSTVKQLEANGTQFEESVLLRSGFQAQSPVNLNRATRSVL